MKPIVLTILDGWGISPSWGGNAIEMMSPRNFNLMWRTYPHLVLKSFFYERGNRGSLANSEIGHMMIGCGRDILADCELIDNEIEKGSFYNNRQLLITLEHAVAYNADIHLIGMISEGCIHSSYRHLVSMLKFFKKNNFNRLIIHAITDGRDVTENSAGIYIDKLLNDMKEIGVGKIGSVAGRSYAMDRDNHWDKTAAYYQAITGNKVTAKALDAKQAIHQAYGKHISDEFIPPTVIIENGFPAGFVKTNDALILTNFRSDRMRQLIMALTQQKRFGLFSKAPANLKISTILKYHFSEYTNRNIFPVFEEEELKDTLPEILGKQHINVLKIAESEKRAHVTYFFNGGQDQAFPGEQRIIIKSPEVKSFAVAPQMNAAKVTETILDAIKKNVYGLIVVNYANVDEVAHTGDIIATSKAVESVDTALGILGKEALEGKITLMITADHGNGEQMVNNRYLGEPEAYHTQNPVPLIIVDKAITQETGQSSTDIITMVAKSNYSLKDIAPTILEMFNIKKPAEMTGKSLLSALKIKE